MQFENQNIEFKQEYVDDIRKEVIAFANAEGGVVYVGIRKDGTPIGIADPDGVMLRTANSLKDAIAPDVMITRMPLRLFLSFHLMFVRLFILQMP